MKKLVGKRIILRQWKKEDLKDLFEYAKLDSVGPNAGWKPHKNIKESKEILESFIKENEVYAIELKNESKVIGSIGFHDRIIDKKYEALNQREIGIALNPKYWGNEYSKEAINLLIQYGFKTLKLDMIWMCHHEENTKSEKMIKKCGFKYCLEKEITLERLNNEKVLAKFYTLKNKF